MPKYEFKFVQVCGGCEGQAKKVLGKIGVPAESVEADRDNNKLYVTSDKPSDELLEALKKTGKEVAFIQ